ncbi:MAG: hypothetical protein HND48_11840 [Chloroflexi bacterium]|nr:hypothetical protein [Chloroflexota bacterium]
MTGAPMPIGADSVVPVENTDADWSAGQSPVDVTVRIAATAGGSVRKRGENVARSQTVLRAGHAARRGCGHARFAWVKQGDGRAPAPRRNPHQRG